MMGRREDHAALESTWSTYEPRTPGKPITKADMARANEGMPTAAHVLEALEKSDHGALQVSAEEWAALRGELEMLSLRPLVYDARLSVLYEAR